MPNKPHIHEIEAEILRSIADAVGRFAPSSTVLSLCFTANANRVAALQDQLVSIDSEIEERRMRRNAAARRLVVLAGKVRPGAEERGNTVAFPVFQRVAP